jgi:hypothetical protein
MHPSEKADTATTNTVTADKPPVLTAEEMAERMCQGLWRLKPNIVLRVEEDGAILFDPDSESVSVVNPTGSALLQWRQDRICFREWCEALQTHYKEMEPAQIQADVYKFLGAIGHFTESYDGEDS